MWNSKKPIKFAHLQKLANQSTLNKAHVIEITKTCTVTFMKAKNPLVVWCREKETKKKKKAEDGENVLFKALAKIFLSTSKNCSWPPFYQIIWWTSWKGNDMLYHYVILRKVD